MVTEESNLSTQLAGDGPDLGPSSADPEPAPPTPTWLLLVYTEPYDGRGSMEGLRGKRGGKPAPGAFGSFPECSRQVDGLS